MKRNYLLAAVSGLLFILLIVMLKRYDVAAIGPAGTSIGFSTINQKIHEATGVNMKWYTITELLGYAAICVCGLFGLGGLAQLISRKSLLKVDKGIYSLAGLYVVVIGFYVFFEKCIINYRPVIMPGETAPEASFPSSHTMLIITVMASAAMFIRKYIRNGTLKNVVSVLCVAVILVTVYGRLICGVHWFTDIVGGILLSVTLVDIFRVVLNKARKADVAAMKRMRAAQNK